MGLLAEPGLPRVAAAAALAATAELPGAPARGCQRNSHSTHGCFHKLGVLFLGVLLIRALLSSIYIRAPDFFGNSHMVYGSELPLRDSETHDSSKVGDYGSS